MKNEFRPVCVPLVTVDPYFSIWSFSDELTREVREHNHFAQRVPTLEAKVETLEEKVHVLEKFHQKP